MSETQTPALPRAPEVVARPGQDPEQQERWRPPLGPEVVLWKRCGPQGQQDAFPIVRYDGARCVRAGHPSSSRRLAFLPCFADWCLTAVRKRVSPALNRAIS